MTTSTLAIIVLFSTIAFFVLSKFARRNPTPNLERLVKVMRVAIFALVAIYLYLRFAG